MPRPIVLIGAGGHASSVVEALGKQAEVLGYVDFKPFDSPLQWLGDDDSYIRAHRPGEHSLIVTMVAGRACSLEARKRLIDRYKGYTFASVTSGDAYIGSNVKIGEGSVVMRRAVVNVNTSLGEHCVVNTGAIVEHDCRIGSNVFIGPGAVICGGVEIGDNVYIGANATIRPGVTVCGNTTIGLASAVVRNITEPGVYAGNPSRKIK